MFTYPLALFSMPGGVEWLFIAGLGLLFFGKRLPEVGRSLGQTIVQFKKGLNDVHSEIEKSASTEAKPDQTKSA